MLICDNLGQRKEIFANVTAYVRKLDFKVALKEFVMSLFRNADIFLVAKSVCVFFVFLFVGLEFRYLPI